MCLLICFFSGWTVFLKGNWATVSVIFSHSHSYSSFSDTTPLGHVCHQLLPVGFLPRLILWITVLLQGWLGVTGEHGLRIWYQGD
jgi:hypothetical protein